MNGKDLPLRLHCCHRKLVRQAIRAFHFSRKRLGTCHPHPEKDGDGVAGADGVRTGNTIPI